MTLTIENFIRALPENSEEVIFSELSLTKHALEILFESNEAKIYQQDLFNDTLKIVEVLEQIRQAETLPQKLDIYYSEYRPLSHQLQEKYADFLRPDTFKEIEVYEKYMDGLREVSIVQNIMLTAYKEETDRINQYRSLYKGIVKLSNIIEEYLPYFRENLIQYIKEIVLALLNDSSLKPDKVNQNEFIFLDLINLKNAAMAVLWQIEENQKESEKLRLKNFSENPALTREMQIQNNQAAMDWANSRLEQIQNIIKVQGYRL
jgi:hypothetical protein